MHMPIRREVVATRALGRTKPTAPRLAVQKLAGLPHTTADLLTFIAHHRGEGRTYMERRRGLQILLRVARSVPEWRDLPRLAALTRDNSSLAPSTGELAYKTVRELGRFLLHRGEEIVPLGTGDLRYARREYFELEAAFRTWSHQHGYAWKRSICQSFLKGQRGPLSIITYDAIRTHYRTTRSSTRRRQLSLGAFCRFLEEQGLITIRNRNYERIEHLPAGLRDPVLRYLDTVIRPRRSQSYRLANEGALCDLATRLGQRGLTTISDLDLPCLEDHIAALQRRKLKSSTINNQINMIETFCATLIEWGILTRQPVRRSLYFAEGRWLPRPLDAATIQKVLHALHARPRPVASALVVAAAVALDCGLRIGEIVNLRRANIDYDAGTIRIDCGKFSKDRIVPMNGEVAVLLKDWNAEHPPQSGCDCVFQHDGRRYSTVAFQAEMKAVAGEIGTPVTFHQFRHTFATRYLERGGRIEVLQRILGHDNINMTLRYARVAPVTVRQDYLRAMHRPHDDSGRQTTSQPRSVLELLPEKRS